MKKLISIFMALCLFLLPAFVLAEDVEKAWTVEMFTDVVTYVYNYGEALQTSVGITIYNVTLPAESPDFLVHLGFIPDEDFVVLTTEKFTYKDDLKIVDHVFYYSYFNEEDGMYSYLPNVISGNHIVLDEDGVVVDMTSDTYAEYDSDGHDSILWKFWMQVYYEYVQQKIAEGRSV